MSKPKSTKPARVDPGLPWRFQSDHPTEPAIASELYPFDELVVGKWFHLERMTGSSWWMRVGEDQFDIHVTKKGATCEKREP